ncbi:MAG: hypothetical protein ABI068_00285 [Ktedonobacterales bacterium]
MSDPDDAEDASTTASGDPDAFEITDLRSGRRVDAAHAAQHGMMRRQLWLARKPQHQRVAIVSAVVFALVALVALTPSLQAQITSRLPWTQSASFTYRQLPPAPTPNIPAPDRAQWTALDQRPLRLPVVAAGAACPTTTGRTVYSTFGFAVGAGPLYAVGFSQDDGASLAIPPTGDAAVSPPGWAALIRVMLVSQPSYSGPALVRGGQLDGAHTLRFNGGIEETSYGYNGDLAGQPSLPAIHLIVTGAYPAGSWYSEFIYVRFQAPGCYALQLDGLSFEEVITFRALPALA